MKSIMILTLLIFSSSAVYAIEPAHCVFRGRVVKETRTARVPVAGVPVIVVRKPVSFGRGRELARTTTDAKGVFVLRSRCRGVALVALFMAPDRPTFPLRLFSSMHRGYNIKENPSPAQTNDILMVPYAYPGKGRFARYEFP